jgi:hypothetical protein
MPMIHRRKKVDKKKRRCLFGAEKIKLDKPNENTNNLDQPIKKNKSEKIVDIKLEEKPIEESTLLKELKPKSKLSKTIEVKEIKCSTKEVCNEDTKKEISSSQVKSKQRYAFISFNFNFVYN